MKRGFSFLSIIVLLAVLVGSNLAVLSDLLDIASPPRVHSAPAVAPDPGAPLIRIGVVSRFAPNLIYAGYQPIMDYLNERGTFHYELRLSTSYQDAVDRLRRREVTASFLGAWITSGLDPSGDLQPVLAPLNDHGTSEFHAVLVAGADSEISSLADLAGRRVALPSPQAWSGNWLQVAGLPGVGLSAADLDSVCHFDHHQTVIWQVLRGRFDAGVVKESVARRFQREGLKLVARSGPIPGPPLVCNRQARPDALEEIARLLLEPSPSDPADRVILDSWTPEFSHGFMPVDMGMYERAFANRGEAP